MHLARFEIKSDHTIIRLRTGSRFDDRPNGSALRRVVCEYDTAVTPHDLEPGESAAQCAILFWLEPLRANSHNDLAVGGSANAENGVVSEPEHPLLHSAFKQVDGRCSEKLGDK